MIINLPIIRALQSDHMLMKGLSQNGINKRIRNTASSLALLCSLHAGAMMKFEKLSLQDSLWLTFTTAATVGYGDLSAKTPAGRFATGTLLYIGGIAIVAQTASLVFARDQLIKENILNGKRKWNMSDHIVILNAPKDNQTGFFKKLITELRSSNLAGSQRPVIIVSPDLKDGLPDDLRKLGVAHVNVDITDPAAFKNSCLTEASVIAILSQDENNPVSDSISYDLVVRAREANPKAVVVAEAVNDANRKRLIACGADQSIRAIRGYPELLVRTILAPGTETVIEDIFNSHGDESVRYDVSIKGIWGDIAADVIRKDIGTPLAYIDFNNKAIPNPDPNSVIEAKALIVIARENNIKKPAEVARMIASAPFVPNITRSIA